MINADQCRRQNEEYENHQLHLIETRERRCRRYAWWDLRGSVCWAETALRRILLGVEMTARRSLCLAAEAIEEGERIVRSLFEALIGLADHTVGTWFLGNDTGYWPLIFTASRTVRSRPKNYTFTRSMALAINHHAADMKDVYNEEGTHVEIRLEDGDVKWSKSGDSNFIPLLPRAKDYPYFTPTEDISRGWRALSYDTKRLNDWRQLPPFDLIAGGGDRLIAKVANSDDIYILILDYPFFHQTSNGRRISLPQSFFKIDPLCGQSGISPSDLTAHVQVPHDDEQHPATERFPLFRKLYKNRFPAVDTMTAWFPPRIWVKVDLRPRKSTSNPPFPYPSYDHVIYLSNLPNWRLSRERVKKSFKYEMVLDLGVGSTHYHEQHDSRFGGEAESLSGQGGQTGKALSFLREFIFGKDTFDAAYRFANGHVEDYGGWLDGTCIYFQLVRLKSEAEVEEFGLKDAYAILWCDEQFAFAERWRLLHIYDRVFSSPFQPIIGEISILEEEYYKENAFDADRYFCPFQEGWINDQSRMAVARQFIAVSGSSEELEHEIFTIHYAWGSMDKTWRRRKIPRSDNTMSSFDDCFFNSADISTLQMRSDSTMILHGSMRLRGKIINGIWSQRVLPAEGQEMPSIKTLAFEPKFKPRQGSYIHPWRFVELSAAMSMHQKFSHYGVLEPVDSRIQAYRIANLNIDFESLVGLSREEIEDRIWIDDQKILGMNHKKIDWADASDFSNNPLSAIREEWQVSLFNQNLAFRIVNRPVVGWLMLFADKRDDKLAEISTRMKGDDIVLTSGDPTPAKIKFNHISRIRNLRDAHGATVHQEPDGISPPAVAEAYIQSTVDEMNNVLKVSIILKFARTQSSMIAPSLDDYENWLAMNVWRVKIACWDPYTHEVLKILDVEHMNSFEQKDTVNVRKFTWFPNTVDQRSGLLSTVLTQEGAILNGTSIWCIGATGLAACPDRIIWRTSPSV